MDDWSQHRMYNDYIDQKDLEVFRMGKSYPRMKRPDKAGIIRRLFGSRTEANANFAAVNVRNDSVVLVKILCVCCKWWLPSDDVGSSPSISK